MSRIRTLVVEDQPIARDRLVELLQSEPDVEVVGAADTGLDAVEAIRRLSPDLVFLDLQIPDLDGFGVIAEVGHAMPLTIFVTAYDEYALRAFDVHAFDYLLKPFGRERFQEALARARARLAEGREEQLARRLVSLVQDVGGPKPLPDRLMVKSGGRVVFLRARGARRRGVGRQLRAPARRARACTWCARRWRASRRDWDRTGSAASIAAGSSTSIACASCTCGPTASTSW